MDTIFTGLTLLVSLAGGACAIILPLVILTALGIFFYRQYQKGSAAKQSAQSWLSTTGIVLASTVQVRRSGKSRSEIPVVVYQYNVNGKSYQGQRIKAGDQFLSIRIAGQAQETVARYAPGTSVTVHYNPANPADSALER